VSSITPSKGGPTTLLAWQDVTAPDIKISSTIDVSGKHAAAFDIRVARRTGTGFTAGWPNIRIEGSPKTSGNDCWTPLYVAQPVAGASIANTTLNGAVSAAATSCVVTSATNIAIGDLLFLGDGSQANYELVRVKSVSGTTVNFEEACTYSHANAAKVTSQAEMYAPEISLATRMRVRAVCDDLNSGQDISIQVLMTTLDSYSVV
jgi:hypothetical protein